RYTGIKLQDFAQDIIGQDGSLRRIISSRTIGDSGYWQVQTLNRFDGNNNPVWNSPFITARVPVIKQEDPAYLQIASPVITSGVYNIIFNGNKNKQGYHLGAVKTGSNHYSWRTSLSTQTNYSGQMPDDGTFDIGNNVEYAGGNVYAIDNQIFWNYHGEFWKNSQTNIWNHYHESGLMLGQFGVVSPEAEALESEAFAKGAGNVFSSTLVKVGNDYYIYHNDESVHGGIHRWKITGLSSILEQTISIQPIMLKTGSLRGRIYSNSDLDPVQMLYETIDSLGIKISERGKSSRWTGFLIADSGQYRFRLLAKGGFRMRINGKLLSSWWNSHTSQLIETPSVQLNGIVPVVIETQSMPCELEWSRGNAIFSKIPANKFISVDYSASRDINLMEGIEIGHEFKDSLYGWYTNPEEKDSNRYLLETGIKSARNKPVDICVHFLSKDSSLKITRNLRPIRVCQQGWQLNGEINLEQNSPSNGASGTSIKIIDNKGKLLCSIRHTYLPYPEYQYPSSISINESPVYNEPLTKTKRFIGRFMPFRIEFNESGIVFYLSNYLPVHVSYEDKDANWKNPGALELYFKGSDPKTMHQLSIRSLIISGSSYESLRGSLKDSICEGERIDLGCGELSRYQWSNGAKGSSAAFIKSGWYFINGTDKRQCQVSSDTFMLNVTPLPTVSISRLGDTLISNFDNGNIWRLNGQELGADKTLKIRKPGMYFCEVKNEQNCTGRDSFMVATLGIDYISKNKNFIFPNPGSGYFTIQCRENCNLSIINSIGICLFETEAKQGENKISIETPGVYLIKTEDSKGIQCLTFTNY
ncbi:MAG: PA14 domain-containing protein, partial [Chitinophagaceae bacterium]